MNNTLSPADELSAAAIDYAERRYAFFKSRLGRVAILLPEELNAMTGAICETKEDVRPTASEEER